MALRNIAADTRYCEPEIRSRRVSQPQPSPERIQARPIAPSHRVVDKAEERARVCQFCAEKRTAEAYRYTRNPRIAAGYASKVGKSARGIRLGALQHDSRERHIAIGQRQRHRCRDP